MSHNVEAEATYAEPAGEKAVGASNTAWNGGPLTLQVNDNANLSPTTNGSMVLAYQNLATVNNQGNLTLTSGGSIPVNLPVPARANAPSIMVNNWQGNNLSASNTSIVAPTPIWIAAIGPGLTGVNPVNLPADGSKVTLAAAKPGQVVPTADGTALPRYMNLRMTASTGDLTIITVIGGPPDASGNNAYVFGLNFAGSGTGYYQTTSANTITFTFNWGSSSVFVANLSPSTAASATVSLTPL